MDKQSEKLIELINTTAKLCRVPMHASIEESYKIISMQIADHLLADEEIKHAFELLKAEKEGRLIVPPCKVGDKVYWISMFKQLVEGEVVRTEAYIGAKTAEVDDYVFDLAFTDIGKTVFLSCEDAEKALKGVE